MSELETSELTNIPSHWQVSTMANETEFITDYVANGSFASLAENVNYKSEPDYAVLIRLTDFNNNYKGDFVYVDKNAYDFLKKSKLVGGEIIISNVGAYAGTVFIAPSLNRPMTLGPNSIMMNFKNGNTFYYYWLKSPMGKFLLEGIISGSAQPKFNKTTFRQMQVPVPPLPEQTAIASVLSSLDDKIDLLHHQNATLEKIAETLFRQWFVEEAQEDWEIGKVSDYAIHFKDSIQPQKNLATLYYHYSIPSYDNGKNPIKENGKEIQSNKYKVPEFCILFSKLNPHKDKRVWLLQNEVGANAICSTEFQVVLPKRMQHLYFLYGWLTLNENYNEIASGVGGTSGSHQRIDPITIYDFQCPLVKDSLIENFNIQIEPLFQKQLINQTQIRTLTALRDTLLPKLMSGEVKVERN